MFWNFEKTEYKGILYDREHDTYIVHFAISRGHNGTTGFPRIEDAIEFRNRIYDEKLQIKTEKALASLRKKDNKEITTKEVFPYNLLKSIDLDLSQISENALQDIMSDLTFLNDREETCITLYFVDNLTLQEISEKYGVTRERIRQIICKASIKIKHRLLRYDNEKLEKSKQEEIKQKVEQEYNDLKAYRERLLNEFVEKGVYTKEMEIVFGEPKKVNNEVYTYYDFPIEDLDLSVRSYNCLRRANIRTIADLLKLEYPMGYLKIRNLGRKSTKEIRDKLYERGLINGLEEN